MVVVVVVVVGGGGDGDGYGYVFQVYSSLTSPPLAPTPTPLLPLPSPLPHSTIPSVGISIDFCLLIILWGPAALKEVDAGISIVLVHGRRCGKMPL